jgi:hypothetical protein
VFPRLCVGLLFWDELTELKLDKLNPGNIYDAFVKLFFSRVIVFADSVIN